MKCGEIWYVDFGDYSVGHEYRKNRPVLLIQCDKVIKIASVISIMPMTSVKDNKFEDDILIIKDEDNRLDFDSILKVQHIFTFDKSRFIKKIGFADKEILDKVKQYLKKHFDL
ncbi:MAG: type II toxin-antitoxin system PemK/MazF family toxin [Candidatus Parcubacteria bacterium]|nr:type II toxin-antitoxin system PemK/MazF family toxin [Candidatus Parcubacteria bacterium]